MFAERTRIPCSLAFSGIYGHAETTVNRPDRIYDDHGYKYGYAGDDIEMREFCGRERHGEKIPHDQSKSKKKGRLSPPQEVFLFRHQGLIAGWASDFFTGPFILIAAANSIQKIRYIDTMAESPIF